MTTQSVRLHSLARASLFMFGNLCTKVKDFLNLLRGVAFIVFVCAVSFLFCDIFNENADRTKTDPFSEQEKKSEGRFAK